MMVPKAIGKVSVWPADSGKVLAMAYVVVG